MNPRTSQEPPALSGMVSCGFHILGAQKRPHHLSQTLKAKPQILLCYPPYKVRRIGGGQRHPRVLPVPGASAGGIRRPLFGLELRRVPLTPRPAPCRSGPPKSKAAAELSQPAPTRPATRVAPMATTELPPEGRGKRRGHS